MVLLTYEIHMHKNLARIIGIYPFGEVLLSPKSESMLLNI